MERSESRPSRVEDFIGIPITGSTVNAARTPGRCAAFPAAAIIRSYPFLSAFFAKSAALSGVRCALITLTVVSISKLLSVEMVAFTVG